jgi:thiol-disulfide isomerase/thioredoxin
VVDLVAPDSVIVEVGRSNLEFFAKQTDIIEAANAQQNTLTPRQKALTVAEVLKRPELWSYRLKVKDTFDVGRERVNKGDTVYLMRVEGNKLVVVPKSLSQNFDLAPEDTDILEQARVNLENPDGAPGILAEELQGQLINVQTGQPYNLNMKALPKYFVIYSAARWCPYTQKFTPDLLTFYKTMKAKGADFEVFYIPQEKSNAELQTYAKEINFPWPTVKYPQRDKLVVAGRMISGQSTPALQVADRYGNIIINNNDMVREDVLKKFGMLLNGTSAKR